MLYWHKVWAGDGRNNPLQVFGVWIPRLPFPTFGGGAGTIFHTHTSSYIYTHITTGQHIAEAEGISIAAIAKHPKHVKQGRCRQGKGRIPKEGASQRRNSEHFILLRASFSLRPCGTRDRPSGSKVFLTYPEFCSEGLETVFGLAPASRKKCSSRKLRSHSWSRPISLAYIALDSPSAANKLPSSRRQI